MLGEVPSEVIIDSSQQLLSVQIAGVLEKIEKYQRTQKRLQIAIVVLLVFIFLVC